MGMSEQPPSPADPNPSGSHASHGANELSPPDGFDPSRETGWLVEEKFGGAIHWIALTDEPWPRHEILSRNDDFDVAVNKSPVRRTKVAGEALRFARKQDAEAFAKLIERFVFTVTVTEHAWDL